MVQALSQCRAPCRAQQQYWEAWSTLACPSPFQKPTKASFPWREPTGMYFVLVPGLCGALGRAFQCILLTCESWGTQMKHCFVRSPGFLGASVKSENRGSKPASPLLVFVDPANANLCKNGYHCMSFLVLEYSNQHLSCWIPCEYYPVFSWYLKNLEIRNMFQLLASLFQCRMSKLMLSTGPSLRQSH